MEPNQVSELRAVIAANPELFTVSTVDPVDNSGVQLLNTSRYSRTAASLPESGRSLSAFQTSICSDISSASSISMPR